MESKWSQKWNELPFEVRTIASKCEQQMRINQLVMERDRVKKYYQRHCGYQLSHCQSRTRPKRPLRPTAVRKDTLKKLPALVRGRSVPVLPRPVGENGA